MIKENKNFLISTIKTIAKLHNINVRFYNEKLTKESREKFCDKMNWGLISKNIRRIYTGISNMSKKLSQELQEKIKRIAANYDVKVRFYNGKLTKKSMYEFSNKINWHWISEYKNLSEDFIREFTDKVNWFWISGSQKLSEEFIREFADKVYWYYISWQQKLSEDFIREFVDKVDWEHISLYQKLSKEFIMEFYDKLNFDNLLDNDNINDKIKEKIKLLKKTIQL